MSNNLIEVRNLVKHFEVSKSVFSRNKKIVKAVDGISFDIKAGDSPIVPIMLYDASLSQKFADMLLEEGVYAIGFFYPVVPKGKARIRTQISAAHERHHLDKAVDAFIKVGKELNVIK